MAKVGLDGHESSAKLISVILSDAGYEVIYTGPRQTPQNIVWASEQEDVDLIGISVLSGAHLYAARETLRLLRERRLEIPLILGGVIPPADHQTLRDLGVAAVFGPGSSTRAIVAAVDELLTARRSGPLVP